MATKKGEKRNPKWKKVGGKLKATRPDDGRLAKPVDIMRVIAIGGGLKIRIPMWWQREMDLAAGDELKVTKEGNTIILKHAEGRIEERQRLRKNYRDRLNKRKKAAA